MNTILEALAVIKGKDATGGAFDSVANKINRLSRAAKTLNRDVNKQLATASRAEIAAERLHRGRMAIGHGAKSAAAATAAYEGSRAVRAIASHTAKSASDRAHEEVRMSTSGMPEHEIREANELAGKLSAKYKSISQTEIMHTLRNMRSVVGTFEEAAHIIDPLLKLRVVAQGAHPERAAEIGEDFDKLVKGMEIKGVTQHMPQFLHYIDNMAKALNVFGDTLRPIDYYEMFKYGRAATNALSDDFILSTAPTLAQELGGSSAGKALSSFHTQFVGGKMSNKAVEALNEIGLLDESKVIKTKTGNVKGVKPGGIVGSEYLTPGKENPYLWVQKVLLPALAAKGITDPAKVQEIIAGIASQATTAQMLSIFAAQAARIEKDAHLVANADGMSAADKFQKSDPKIARRAVEAQVDNYLSSTANPFVPAATTGMNWLSSGLAYMSDRAAKNPVRAAGELGWLTAMIGALGLDSMSAALGSAGRLFRGEALGGAARFGLSKLTAAAWPIIDIATRPDVLDPNDPHFSRYAPLHHDKLSKLSDLDRSDSLLPKVRPESWLGRYVGAIRAGHEAEREKIEAELRDLGFAGPSAPGRGLMAGQYTVEDIRKAIGGPAAGPQEAVRAEVVGNATLDATIKVEPSPLFRTMVDQHIDNKINAFRASGGPSSGSTGSTGGSMPEATAPM
ncbi:MAG: hypothetical protein KDE14_01575 [Rhodobacteraceae bacterium]|nr:hypothetical protein [Paracoccaceae bacterium]